MENSPVTPKKRYSCTSEYATPKESDDSDNSLYYSFVLSDDDNAVNKENSINGGQWTITDTANSPVVPRVSKAKTPLLRKVLQLNHTPRNKNNKRVSFSHLAKPNSTPTATIKITKTKDLDDESIDLDRNVFYDLKPIEESLPIISNQDLIVNKNEEESKEAADSKNSIESMNDSSSDVTDDLDSELHNTIIENLSSATNSTLTSNNEECSTSTVVSQSSIEKSLTTNEAQSPKTEPQLASVNNVPRTIEEILSEGSKNVHKTRNITKIDRQRLNVVNDSRKSILPIAKKTTRATTYKRRSSTYEPRKVDPRKSLGVLKEVASKVKRTIGVQKIPSTNQIGVSSTAAKPLSKKSDTFTLRMPTLKPRLTLANQHPPRVPIVSTRQSISTSVRAQRRETKNSLTTLAVAKASTSSDLTRSSASNHAMFIKPSGVPVRSKPTVPILNGNGNVNGKCQYCDKFFAKTHGMTTHLLEKCEKIPASARRQLLQKEKRTDEANSKQVSRRSYAFRQDIDSISKYSRFFVNLTNEGASATRGDGIAAIDVESGLKNLRAELRKIKNAYSGITRTPSKPIRCHICNKLFLDCVEYADHSTNHPPV